MRNHNHHSTGRQSGKVAGGLVLVLVGLALLAAKTGFFFFPPWVFSWPMFLIALGIFLGFRHSFQKPGWLVLVIIGGVFLLDNHFLVAINLKRYFWPILIIGLGLWLMLRPKKRNPWDNQIGTRPAAPAVDETTGYYTDPTTGAYQGGYTDYTGTDAYTAGTYTGEPDPMAYGGEDFVDSAAIFGGIKKNIVSKNFKGGEVVSVFGGTELNLMQADIQHPVVLEATQIFGGTTLIVPPHWQIKSEMVAILGGIEDKRPAYQQGYDPNKILILKGTTLFGGLNIKSY
jgi:predicted membrane protein